MVAILGAVEDMLTINWCNQCMQSWKLFSKRKYLLFVYCNEIWYDEGWHLFSFSCMRYFSRMPSKSMWSYCILRMPQVLFIRMWNGITNCLYTTTCKKWTRLLFGYFLFLSPGHTMSSVCNCPIEQFFIVWMSSVVTYHFVNRCCVYLLQVASTAINGCLSFSYEKAS